MKIWPRWFPAWRRTPLDPATRAKLPEINAFVEIAVNGGRRRSSVAVDAITADTLITRQLAGLQAGDGADFSYTNDCGRFRFTTNCTAADGRESVFALPAEITTIVSFANRRAAPRVPYLCPAGWRYVTDGEPDGAYSPASMMDVSSCGTALLVAEDIVPGTVVEVRFSLPAVPEPVVARSEVVRSTKIETSDKNAAGMKFVGVDDTLRERLSGFVSEQQQSRRQRGVV